MRDVCYVVVVAWDVQCGQNPSQFKICNNESHVVTRSQLVVCFVSIVRVNESLNSFGT